MATSAAKKPATKPAAAAAPRVGVAERKLAALERRLEELASGRGGDAAELASALLDALRGA